MEINDGSNEQVQRFNQSFKPILVCLKFVGIPLNFYNKQQKSRKVFIAVPIILGCCLVLSNLFLNGPRGIELQRLDWMKDIRNFESPREYFKTNPFGIIKLVKIISDMIFFCYVPFIYLVFIGTIVFDPNWSKMILILQKIHREMKLSLEYYYKCRRLCYITLFLFLAVSN